MTYAPGAITKWKIYLDSNTLHEASRCKITHVNSLINTSTCPNLLRNPCSNILHNSLFSWKGRNQLTSHRVLHHTASKKWLVHGVATAGWTNTFLLNFWGCNSVLDIFTVLCIIVPVAWFYSCRWWVPFITQHSNQFV